MDRYAYIMAGALVAKLYARYWSFRPMPVRPVGARTNDVLKLIDLAALTAICCAFFFMLRPGHAQFAFTLAGGLLVLDLAVRQVFIEVEARRLCGRSRKWSRRTARRHVSRRAVSSMYN